MKNVPRFTNSSAGIISSIVIALAIYRGGGYFMYCDFFTTDPSHAGTFGDMFGGITSLFSALAIILVIYATRLQKQELDALKAELRVQNETTQFLEYNL